MDKLIESIGKAAEKIAFDIEANCIIAIRQFTKEERDLDEQNILTIPVVVSVLKVKGLGLYEKTEFETELNKMNPGSTNAIKDVLEEAINKQLLEKGDKVVCVTDSSFGPAYKGLIFILDVDKVFFNISTHNLSQIIPREVIESVIDIAREISKEGREGKKIGTAFLIGEKSEILKSIKQMIINPFMGYPEEQRKITDPALRETVKEFSQLDGVFVVNEDGTIITAGAYIDVDTAGVDLPGLGTKHRNCAAITKTTNSLAVVVSSSGTIRVFKEGRSIIKLSG